MKTMTFSKIDSIDGNGTNYLRVSDLVEGMIYTKVALVTSADAALAKNNMGFAKFYLKDVDANVVRANLFNVENFSFAALQLPLFVGKPVELTFTAQLYNGSISLLINGETGIKEWTGEFDRKKFVGIVNFDEEVITKFGQAAFGKGWEFPAEYKVLTSNHLGQGRVGAFGKIVEIALATLVSEGSLLGKDFSTALRIFFIAVDTMYSMESTKQNAGVLEDVKTFDIIMAITNRYRDDEYYAIILDCTKAITGIAKPKHLISHLICRAFNQATQSLDLVCTNNVLVNGATASVGGALLSKF